MLRTVFALALAIALLSSLASPAFSLPPSMESGPLTAFRHNQQVPSDSDLVNFHGFAVDKNSIRSDFGPISLGDLSYNGKHSRTLVHGSGNFGALVDNAHFISGDNGWTWLAPQPP